MTLAQNKRNSLIKLRNAQAHSEAWFLIDDMIQHQRVNGFFKKTPAGPYRPSAAGFATVVRSPTFFVKYGGKSHVLEKRGRAHVWKSISVDEAIERLPFYKRIWMRMTR